MKLALLITTCFFGCVQSTGAMDELKVGALAPEFSLKGTDGKTYVLSEFKGKQPVVIAWFPKAFTRNCTEECRQLRSKKEELQKLGVVFLAASCDHPRANQSFVENLELNFPVLSDPKGNVATKFGIYNSTKKVARRTTFFVSKDGIVVGRATDFNVANHGNEVLKKVKELFK